MTLGPQIARERQPGTRAGDLARVYGNVSIRLSLTLSTISSVHISPPEMTVVNYSQQNVHPLAFRTEPH